jgi:hypothetical protein
MKKAQTVMVSFAVILVISIIFMQLFTSEFQKFMNKKSEFDLLEEEAGRIGNLLTGQAVPNNWVNIKEVKKMGLLKDSYIPNSTLVKYATLPYSNTKMLLATQHDYLFYFSNGTAPISIGGKEYWGFSMAENNNGGSDLESALSDIYSKSKTLAKDERLVNLKEKSIRTIRMVIYVWN